MLLQLGTPVHAHAVKRCGEHEQKTGARAHAPHATRASNRAGERDTHGETGEVARLLRRGRGDDRRRFAVRHETGAAPAGNAGSRSPAGHSP
jgi:hypothetical protein